MYGHLLIHVIKTEEYAKLIWKLWKLWKLWKSMEKNRNP